MTKQTYLNALSNFVNMANQKIQKSKDVSMDDKIAIRDITKDVIRYIENYEKNKKVYSEEEIGEDFLRPMTMSFGITALNETSILYNGKSIAEDNTFAIEVLKFINEYADRIKKEDNILYAIYRDTCRIPLWASNKTICKKIWNNKRCF